jgi:hypothetical protein
MTTVDNFNGISTLRYSGEGLTPLARLNEHGSNIGNALFEMNEKAYNSRYPQHATLTTWNYLTSLDLKKYEPIELFVALDCLSYQCSEGNVPESALFKELEQVRDQIACSIVRGLPEYSKVPWG